MTKQTAFIILTIALLFSTAVVADENETLTEAFQKNCLKCHGKTDKIAGDVNLATLKAETDLLNRAALLETLIDVLKDREMPPENASPLPDETRKHMVVQLQALLRKALKTKAFEPTPIRRMNRFQYNNAVVDLLKLDRPIFRLNERLIRRRDDYFHPETRKMPAQVRVSTRPLSKDIDNQRPEGFKGVAAFPQDKRAEHGFDNRADHLTMSPLLMESFLRLSQTIVESQDLNSRECRSWDRFFAAPGNSSRIAGRFEGEIASQLRIEGKPNGVAPQEMTTFGSEWSGNSQLFWRCTKEGQQFSVSFNVEFEGDGLHLEFTRAPDYGIFDVYLDGKLLSEKVDLYAPKVSLTTHNVKTKISTGRHVLLFKCVGKRDISPRFFFGLDFLQIKGQKRPEVEKAKLTAAEEIRDRLKTLLRRAFRRPVDEETLNRFSQFAIAQLAAGEAFEDTMRTIVGAVLGMPDFLYFYESHDDGNNPGRQAISDFELASRLSQFFWSSIPDDKLLDLAESGKLRDSKVLGEQIDRMMNDRRSSRFCDNFPSQWLQLDRLITSIPDKEKFPYFYYHGYRTSLHMMSEPLLLFETVFVEDLSVIDLIDPKFTWQSAMLKANYQGNRNGPIEVNVQLFKREKLTDPRRGGVITNAAIMTMTSTPVRTQPITRGAWVNAVIFNDPPEPPPADVPPLPEVDKAELEKLTIRERLAVHRKRTDCASCHNKIDPLGFALENYGPTGIWRDKYENGRDVDVSGILFNQHKFQTVVEFKQLIVQEKQRFIRAFVSHLMSYALGRELGPADSPALDDITAKALAGQDSMRTILKNIAMSEPFLHKNTSGEKIADTK